MGIKLREDCKRKAKQARQLSGCHTIVKLTLECKVSEGTIYQFFKGERVSIENFQKICKRLGLDWREVCDMEEGTIPLPDNDKVNAFEDTSPFLSTSQIPDKITPERPDGWVALDSPFYVQRPPKEQDCYNEICKPGCLIRIKAPKQMGKTSLMMRILQQAEKQGDRIVYLSLDLAEKKSFSNLDTFLRWFCAGVGHKLKLENKLDEYWEDVISSSMRCETYFEEYLLPEIDKSLTLGLDNVDRLFQYPEIYGDFFALLRYFYQESGRNDTWKKLRLVLAHSTEMYLKMDINRSPFNAGLPVNLPEFTSAQVLDLAQHHQINWSDEQVQELMSMVGGHPFLVGLALYHIARNDLSLTQLLQTAPTESGIYKHHLYRIVETLEKQPELATAIKKVVTSESSVYLERVAKFKLQALGLVNVQNDEVTPRCQLYRQFFQKY